MKGGRRGRGSQQGQNKARWAEKGEEREGGEGEGGRGSINALTDCGSRMTEAVRPAALLPFPDV